MPHPLNIIQSRYFTSIRCTPAHPTCTIQSVINLPICVIPSHLLDDITSHSFYPIVKWLFSSFLPSWPFASLVTFFLFFHSFLSITSQLICCVGVFCLFSLPHSFLSSSRWWQWEALTSRRIPAPSQPLSSTMSMEVYTHIHASHMHTYICIIYITVTVCIHMCPHISPPPLLSLHYIDMLFKHPYSFILSTAGLYLPNYRAVTNPTVFITYEVIRAINDL